ncbi:MAG: arginine deiminase [Mycoplasmataceae bacterium]|nr:arginine deiminase [Mycoplasmataceae bacterium]
MKIKVYSEIGKLRKVLLHRPGKEVSRIYPEIFERILFDDIMWLEQAQKDHDIFANQLRENDVEVFYIEKLVGEIFDEDINLRTEFLNRFIKEGGVRNESLRVAIFDHFNKIKDNHEFVSTLIGGVMKLEIEPNWDGSIDSNIIQHDNYPFYLDPIPNILFQRDPIASVFNGINVHNMTKETRKREAIFYDYLLKYHTEFKDTVERNIDLDHQGHMEGGDILVISKELILVGVSERTTADGASEFAKNMFKKHKGLKRVIGIEIPPTHATMHLDTVVTQMDYDKFSVDLDMADSEYFTYEMTPKGDDIEITTGKFNILDILKKYVHKDAKLIRVAGGDYVHAKAEQWNDAANCLALEPGKIFVYDRNVKTNAAILEAGVELLYVPSGELGRGRGGPRCMSMPLERDEI